MTVLELMTSPAVTCHVNDTCQAAAHAMRAHDCGAIAVINDEGKLTGIVTDRDICMTAASNARVLDDILVNVAMSTNVLSARPTDKIGEIEELMASHRIRRLPVIDRDGKPIGLISLDDLARKGRGLVEVGRTLASICSPAADA
jgi:CBS domain-containing protein